MWLSNRVMLELGQNTGGPVPTLVWLGPSSSLFNRLLSIVRL